MEQIEEFVAFMSAYEIESLFKECENLSKNMHFHLMLPTSKISTIKVRTCTAVISLARRHTLLGCETKAMITKAM